MFYISYTCNELISLLSSKNKNDEIQYTSIFNFYYNVSLSYNKAIKGFLDINEKIKNKEKELKDYMIWGYNEAPPINIIK